MEKEFLIIKPSTVKRGLIGSIISEVEKRGIKIIAMKMLWISRTQACELYKEHEGRDYFEPLVSYAISGPVVALVVSAERAVQHIRHICGSTDPLKAEAASIRGKYGLSVRKNVVHSSDSHENALREMKIFFNENELFEYEAVYEKEI